MKAYKQVENALLPEMKFLMLGRTTMAKRVLRLTLLEWPVNSMPEIDSDKRTIAILKSSLKGRIEERYKQDYGSVVLMFIVGLLAEFAIKKLLEWWFNASNRGVIKEAITELKGLSPVVPIP